MVPRWGWRGRRGGRVSAVRLRSSAGRRGCEAARSGPRADRAFVRMSCIVCAFGESHGAAYARSLLRVPAPLPPRSLACPCLRGRCC